MDTTEKNPYIEDKNDKKISNKDSAGKKKAEMTLHISSLVLFTIFILEAIFSALGYELLIGKHLVFYLSLPFLWVLILILEIIAFIIHALRKGKLRFALISVLLIPILLFFILFSYIRFCVDNDSDIQRFSNEKFEREIVVANRMYLLSNFAKVYESKNGFILHHVVSPTGELQIDFTGSDSEFGTVAEVTDSGIDFYRGTEGNKYIFLRLKYENGHFFNDPDIEIE